MRPHDTTAEAEDRVRHLLGPADPRAGRSQNGDDPALGERGQQVLARVLATDPRSVKDHRTAHWSRRRRWAVATAASAAILGGVGMGAQAAGVLPDNVIWGLSRADDYGAFEVDLSKADMLFAGSVPDGTRLEYWEAPNASGGTCTYLRTITPEGEEDGETECGNGIYGDPVPDWSTNNTTILHDWTTVYGHAPESAVSVRYILRDGSVEGPFTVDRNGYFLGFTPAADHGLRDWYGYTVKGLDARGRVVWVDRDDIG